MTLPGGAARARPGAMRHLLGIDGWRRERDRDAARSGRGPSAGRPASSLRAPRQGGGQPLLRGLHPHPDFLRDRRQGAGRRGPQLDGQGSSVSKGETLLDTVRNIEAMGPAAIVIRHRSSGAPHLVAAARALRRHQRRAMAPTSTPRRRCWTPSPCDERWGTLEGRRCHRGRHPPQPRGALEHLYCLTALGRPGGGVRPAHADARGAGGARRRGDPRRWTRRSRRRTR